MVISLSKVKDVLPEFARQRLMPGAPVHVQWLIAGSINLLPTVADTYIQKNLAMLTGIGIVNDQGQVDIEMAKSFMEKAFADIPKVPFLGFVFDKSDGEAFINLLENHKDG